MHAEIFKQTITYVKFSFPIKFFTEYHHYTFKFKNIKTETFRNLWLCLFIFMSGSFRKS